jgi:uncharacterized protein YneF (UPF0154 family)
VLILFVFLVVGLFFGMFEVLRWTSEHFAQSPTGPAKGIKLVVCQVLLSLNENIVAFSPGFYSRPLAA